MWRPKNLKVYRILEKNDSNLSLLNRKIGFSPSLRPILWTLFFFVSAEGSVRLQFRPQDGRVGTSVREHHGTGVQLGPPFFFGYKKNIPTTFLMVFFVVAPWFFWRIYKIISGRESRNSTFNKPFKKHCATWIEGFQTSAGPSTVQSFLCRLCSCNDLNVPIRVFCHQPTSGTCKLRAVHYRWRIQIQAYHFYGRFVYSQPHLSSNFCCSWFITINSVEQKGLPGKALKTFGFWAGGRRSVGPSETEECPWYPWMLLRESSAVD